ncbi:hypothetical protein pb186bvf_018569 [Paramecium bursaria]
MDNKIEKEQREKVDEYPFALNARLNCTSRQCRSLLAPKRYTLLSNVKVYRTDTYELIHEHEESKSNYLYVSFNEFKEYMLLYIQPMKIEMIRQQKFIEQVISRRQILQRLKTRDAEKNIETQSQVEIYKFDVYPYINQLDLIKGRLDENYSFIYESMNQERQLVVLSSKKDKYPKRFIKLIRYDAEKENQILRTRRVFQKLIRFTCLFEEFNFISRR